MPRSKVNFGFIEDESKRKVSYQKRLKGLLKKSNELKTLCDVEVAVVIYGSYKNEPEIFPSNDAVHNTFIKFKALSTLEKSKNMMTREELTTKRIRKLEEQIKKVKKENWVKEITNEMYEVLNGKKVSANMHPYYHNDLSCVIKKNLKQVRELIKKRIDGEGSSSNAPQPIVESMVTGRTNSGGPMDPYPLLFSQIFPPMVSQLFSPMPQQMAIRRKPGVASPMPSTIMDSPIPSPMYSQVLPSMTQQIKSSTNIPPIGVSTSMNNDQNNSDDLPQSPSLSGLLRWNDDDPMTLLNDPFFKNIHAQDPNHTNNF